MLRQNDRYFADDIFKCKEKFHTSIYISLKIVPTGPIDVNIDSFS